MKDCFGRDIKPGDVVAYSSRWGSGTYLTVGQAMGPGKKDPEKVRVRVFHSNNPNFAHGRKDWKTGQYVREPCQPYMVTLSMSDRVVIVNNDVVSFKP